MSISFYLILQKSPCNIEPFLYWNFFDQDRNSRDKLSRAWIHVTAARIMAYIQYMGAQLNLAFVSMKTKHLIGQQQAGYLDCHLTE